MRTSNIFSLMAAMMLVANAPYFSAQSAIAWLAFVSAVLALHEM